jgi:protoporphyrinogen oxidase
MYKADYLISSMPIRDLIKSFDRKPAIVKSVAEGLVYRDFMTVGLLAKKIILKDRNKQQKMIRDNWLYIQEPDVKIGRIQIFNNWSQYLVREKKNVWLGLEYFCNEGDEFWMMKDKEFSAFAISELEKINVLKNEDVLKTKVVRVKKAYPAYFGTYDQIETIKKFTAKFKNLYLVGRNGMHRYNNIDHSMLTAMAAVENIIKKRKDNENIWQVNAEQEYHEKKSRA